MGKDKKYTEVLWCGRGGQGAITASKLVAEASVSAGFRGVTTAPFFGAERRGAPVSAFLRLSNEPIRIFSKIQDPDIIVILDPTLLPVLRIEQQYDENKTVIINSTKTPKELGIEKFEKVGVADVTKAALDNGLTLAGVAILNTPILGAFVKTTGLVSLADVEEAIGNMFSPEKAALNIRAAEDIYKSTEIYIRGVKQ